MKIARRTFVATAAAAALAAPSIGRAQARKFVVMCHAVHQRAITDAKGGDATAAWRQRTGMEIEWLTFGVEAVHERVYREATLAQGGVDACMILERFGGPHIAPLFDDLAALHAREPIENLEEIGAGMRAAHTYGGKMIGIPYRHATHGLFYNEEILKERGIARAPASFEDVIEFAEKCSFVRADGTRVHGFATSMDDPSGIGDVIRAFGGNFISNDYKFRADEPEAVRAITLLRDWYQKQVIPRNMMTFKTEEVITAIQQGRAAITNQPFGRFNNYNDPKQSKYPGAVKVTNIPLLKSLGRPGLSPAKTSVWAFAIPKNARDKALSWSFIREVSNKENTIKAAMNGNGPVRLSAYDDPRVQQLAPFSAQERQALPTAVLVLPGFAEAARAMDIFMEEVQKVMLGASEPLAGMKSARARIEPLLPKA